MVPPRLSALRTAKRRPGWWSASLAAAVLLLMSQGVEPARVFAQSQTILEGTVEVQCRGLAVPGARLTHTLNTGRERIPSDSPRNPPDRLLTRAHVRVRRRPQYNGMLLLPFDEIFMRFVEA